jgi:hypothetical protein
MAWLSPAISAFERGSSGIDTTPSIVWTKLVNREGSSIPNGPP